MRKVLTLAFVTALSSLPVHEARAQSRPLPDPLAHATLEELLNITITTASRTPEGAAKAPARVRVVTGEDVKRRGYKSLADLLADLPEFKLDFGGDQDYPAEYTVQGSRGSNRIVVLLDGIRISSPTNEPLPILANYPVHAARQIEILYGPASALYGADAFSAVVNIITRDSVGRSGLIVSSTVGQYGLFNHTGSLALDLGRHASLTVAGQALVDRQPDLSRYYPGDFGGLEAQRAGIFPTVFGPMSPGTPVPSEYRNPMRGHSMQATLRAGGFQFLVFQNGSRLPTAPAYNPDNAVYSDAAFSHNRLFVGAASFTRTFDRLTSTSTLTVSRHELDPDSGYQNVYSNMQKSFKYAYGSMTKVDQQLTWRLASGLTLTAGGNAERYFAIPQGADLNSPVTSHDVPGTILGTDIPDAFIVFRYGNVGGYAQAQYEFASGLSVIVGGRGDYNTRYGATFNPRAGIVTSIGPLTALKVMYGTAFLSPSPYQSSSHYGSFYSTDGGATYQSDYWHIGNPDLKPQKKRTTEIEVQHSVTTSMSVTASAFYTQFWDLIKESDPDQAYSGLYLGWPVAYIDFPVNEGRGTTYGGTLGFEFLQAWRGDRRLAARAAVSLADGWTADDDQPGRLPIGAMAPVQARAGLDLDWGAWTIAPRLTAVGKQRVLATETRESSMARRTLDGYVTASINIRRANIFKHATAFVSIDNLFDARYRHINARAYTNPEELIGAPQAPRRIMVGIELEVGRR